MVKEYFTTFYLDKERDIVVNLYKIGEDELAYVIETPNHSTGNLITNLAKISGKEITKNEKDLKIVVISSALFGNEHRYCREDCRKG